MVFYGGHKKCNLRDGAAIAYSILGSDNLGKKRPLVLINGMSGAMGDWVNLTRDWEKIRPSEFISPSDVILRLQAVRVLIFDHR